MVVCVYKYVCVQWAGKYVKSFKTVYHHPALIIVNTFPILCHTSLNSLTVYQYGIIIEYIKTLWLKYILNLRQLKQIDIQSIESNMEGHL